MKNLNRYRSLDEVRAVVVEDATFGCWVADPSKVAISDTSKRPLAVNASGKITTLYRLAYELTNGPITDAALVVDHACRDHWCARPLHLEPVTRDENERRKVQSYRMRIAKCPRGHKLDEHTRLLSRRGGVLCRECVREDAMEFRP